MLHTIPVVSSPLTHSTTLIRCSINPLAYTKPNMFKLGRLASVFARGAGRGVGRQRVPFGDGMISDEILRQVDNKYSY
jgi:hypothetical protein